MMIEIRVSVSPSCLNKSTEYGLQFAALVIGFLPILIFYAIANKYITQGVIAGAIKE
jgi:raffinose/stachyose/melibiose transport system permease protein